MRSGRDRWENEGKPSSVQRGFFSKIYNKIIFWLGAFSLLFWAFISMGLYSHFTSKAIDEVSLAQACNDTFLFSGLLAAFMIGMSFFGLFLVRKFGTEPLRKLRDGAMLFGQGKLSHRIDIDSGDEIGDLADSFNTMAEKIQESHSSMENRINERTGELSEKVAELQALTSLMTGREKRMIELKKEINSLLDRLGEDHKYNIDRKPEPVEAGNG